MDEIAIEETGPDFLLATLEHYLESGDYSDVVLISQDGDRLPAHRAVLSSASKLLHHIFITAMADPDISPDVEGGLQIQFPHTSTRDLYAFLQLAYCGNMEIGGSSQDPSRKSVLIGVLQMLGVTEDVVILDSDQAIKVNDINLPGDPDAVGNHHQSDDDGGISAPDHDDEGLPNIVTSILQPSAAAKPGTISLSRVLPSKQRPVKATATLTPASVTVQFKPKKRPAPPPAAVQLSVVRPAAASLSAAPSSSIRPAKVSKVSSLVGGVGAPMPKLPLLTAAASFLPQQPLPPIVLHTNRAAELPPIVPNPAMIGIKGMITDRAEADRITREVLDLATVDHGMNRRCERCQCPNCAAIEGGLKTSPFQEGGTVKNLHVCHYADCGKKYKKTSHLRAHLRWHIGDQPFHCSWEGCGRKFTRSDELHRHFRIHTGEKNHICEVCQKAFSRSDHLKKHLMSHAAAGHVIGGVNDAAAAIHHQTFATNA